MAIHGRYGVIRGLRIVAKVLWLLGCYRHLGTVARVLWVVLHGR